MKGNTGRSPAKRTMGQDVRVVANQWQSNPRQQKFLEYYFEPKSSTFSNVYQSAIRAGYSESHASTLTRTKNKNMWLIDYQSKQEMLPEHITQGIINIANSPHERAGDRLRAYELLGKLQGLFVDKSITAHVNIEQVIAGLK